MHRPAFLAVLFATHLLPGQQATPAVAAWQVLCDGKSLARWDGEPGLWSVQDGCIKGSTVGHPIEHNSFLIWRGDELRDFELTFRARLEGNNSGVQYRSHRLQADGFGVAGYQFDIHPQADFIGQLYEEGGRGIVARRGEQVVTDLRSGAPRVTGALAAATPIDLTQWTSYRIVARGTRLRHEVNGVVATTIDDQFGKAARQGILALQLHAGEAMTVWFKDLRLSVLPAEEVAAVPAQASAGPRPHWLWDGKAEKDEELWFRRTFELAGAPASARLVVTADNHCRVFLNGEQVCKGDTWEAPVAAAVQQHLRSGHNVIAVYAANDSSAAGLAAELRWRAADGKEQSLVSDASWRLARQEQDGWQQPGFDDSKWAAAVDLGELGAPGLPWSQVLGADAFAAVELDDGPQPAIPAPELRTLPGFTAERVLAVPRALGSWVCLAVDPKGRLYTSDQTRGLYRITPARLGDATATTTIEKVAVELEGCHGLLWAHDALYAVVNGEHGGLYRLRDSNGDDVLDQVECLRAIPHSAGEHGPHAVVLAPDGNNLLIACGNHTPLPQFDGSLLPRNWGEDQLLPRLDDPNGHAVGIMAPGGFVAQVDPEGRHWQLFCAGFRNQYDVAVSRAGELFTYDSDMEWDMGTPWYRATRVCHLVSGAEFGWRHGSGPWPPDYPDSLPPLLDIGPGSPTGMAFGYGAKFPTKYQEALYLCDWTFGTIYAVHLHEQGATYGGEREEFLAGAPLAVADLVVGGDGAMYLVTGGRGLRSFLYRVFATSALPAAPVAQVTEPHAPVALRRRLETFHGHADAGAVAAAWPHLGDQDRFLRYAARIAVEWQPVAEWRARALGEPLANVWSALTALLALARQGDKDDLPALLTSLSRFDLARLDQEQQVALLRIHELALIRLGPIADELRLQTATRLLPLFPLGNDRTDRELCALLCRLDAPGVVDKAMPLLLADTRTAAPAWMDVTTRNASYGGVIQKMIADMPPASAIAYANALRTVPHGFTLEQRQALLQFLAAAMKKPGGASYRGFVSHMFDDVVGQLTVAEKNALAAVIGKKPPPIEPFHSTPPKGPGRHWQVDEAASLASTSLRGRSFQSGRNLFHAASCAACHHFAGEGGSGGPDLTSLGNKFSARDVLESILEPSKVVSDQYAGAVLTRKDGTSIFGRVVAIGNGSDAGYEVLPAVVDPKPVRVPASEVAGVAPSKLSPMPANLVDQCNQDELLDLVAFLLSRGDEQSAMFRR